MTRGGQHPFGDGPEDPDRPGGGGPEEDDLLGSADDEPLLGWVAPQDRTWRHPSELRSPRAEGPSAPNGPPDPPISLVTDPSAPGRRSGRSWAMVAGGTGIAAAVLAVGLLLVTSSGPSPTPTHTATAVGIWKPSPVITPQGGGTGLSERVAGSTVLLVDGNGQAAGSTETEGAIQDAPPVGAAGANAGTGQAIVTAGNVRFAGRVTPLRQVRGCGVVVGKGLVATTVDAVAGGTGLVALTDRGQRLAVRIVARDRKSDVALLHIGAVLPVARFVDDQQLRTGSTTRVLSLIEEDATGATGATATTGDSADEAGQVWSTGTVTSVGTRVPEGTAEGMAAITTTGPVDDQLSGDPLVDDQGDVMGLLDATAEGSGTGNSYLPAQLVVGVADQLAATGHVRHGWLGVVGRDASAVGTPTTGTSTEAGTGAQVVRVVPHSPAQRTVRAGDVIVGINGAPVRTMAELRSRLYVLAPGATVQLTLERGGVTHQVRVRLGSSP